MSSRHSILLGTDGPDGDSSTGRVLMPSAHVLAATTARTRPQQHTMSTSTGDDGPMTERADAASSTSSGGFGDSSSSFDADTSAALPPRSTGAPRALAWSEHSPSSPPAASATMLGITPDVAESMSLLSAEFASLLGQGAGKEDEEFKHLEQVMGNGPNVPLVAKASSLASYSMFADSTSSSFSGATAEPQCLCFDLITSTATRVPQSTILAAMAPSVSAASAAAAAASSSADLGLSASFVAVEPIDWSRHDVRSTTFARLTSRNAGADAVDEIAMELAAEKAQVEQTLVDARREIAQQKETIARLQRQLREAGIKPSSGDVILTAHTSVSSAAAAPAAAGSREAPSATSASYTPVPLYAPISALPSDDESDPDEEEDESEGEELDIDEGMADEEDSGHGIASRTGASSSSAVPAAAAGGKTKTATASFSTQT